MGQKESSPNVCTQAPKGTMGAVTRAFQLGRPLKGAIKGGGVAISGNIANNNFNVSTKVAQKGTQTPGVMTAAPKGTMGTVVKSGMIASQSKRSTTKIQGARGR